MILMETFTTAEISALFGVDERRVRKDVEHGIIGATNPPRFRFADVVYFVTVKAMKLELSVGDRKRLHDMLVELMSKTTKVPSTIELSPVVYLKIEPVVREARTRSSRFDAWKRLLVEDPGILAGEPVFPKSRLAVRHVGDMLRGGTPVDEIREDYPYLTDDDVEFAPLYTVAYPRLGRPRADQAPPR
jgi:uncharacterized protein (DUF433 family)